GRRRRSHQPGGSGACAGPAEGGRNVEKNVAARLLLEAGLLCGSTSRARTPFGEPVSNAAATLPQLTAILEEIAALVRAGVPLDQGLLHMGGDFPGRAGELMRALAEDVRCGESLPSALAERGTAFPPVFRGVVEAGLRSGQ